MNKDIAAEVALEVIRSNNFALIGIVNNIGNPNIKALVKITHFFNNEVNKKNDLYHFSYFFDIIKL